ncbi:MAG: hypothetical protein Kow0073_08090 [Immundisolibacter sp.]
MTRTVSTAAIAAVLLAAMAATRSHHFADLIGPGDASVAAFFLGGWLLRRAGWFVLLAAVAGLIDLLALWGGTSAACVTPGYAVLLPAYGALWLAGGRAGGLLDSAPALLRGAAWLVAGTVAFFALSNLGFYAFSPALAELTVMEFAARVAVYLPGYLAQAFLFAAAGLAVARLLGADARPAAAAA